MAILKTLVGGVVGLAALILASIPSGAAERCPCEHKAPGLEYVSSRKPISPAHAQCLVPINAYLSWVKEQANARDKGSMDRIIIESSFNMFSGFDWGVPSKEKSQQNLAQHTSTLAESASELAESSAKLEKEKSHEGNKVKGAEGIYRRAITDLEGTSQLMASNKLQQHAALVAFFQCVLDHDLPMTNENW
mgnify:CR=1 FL=1